MDHWIWEVRVTRHVQMEYGLVVFRQRRELQVLRGKPYDQSGLRADPYLIRDGYAYELPSMFWVDSDQGINDVPTPDRTAADDRREREEFMRSGRENFIKQLRAGEVTPRLFFPIKVGLKWAERWREDQEYQEWSKNGKEPDSFYHWVVVAKGGRGHCECMNLPATAYDILYFTVGGPSEIFFQDGVGVIGEWSRHIGTYWEETTTLKKFVPAPGSTRTRLR